MTFIHLAENRYSVRVYQKKEVETEKLDTILKAGWVAPSAGNQQPNQFVVVNTTENQAKLSKGVSAHGAPLAIIVCTDEDVAWKRPFDGHSMVDIDATIATDHMMMCAEDLGLATCWLTYFDPKVICTEFNIPPNLIPVSILAIGYSADEKPQSPERHTTTRNAQIIKYGAF